MKKVAHDWPLEVWRLDIAEHIAWGWAQIAGAAALALYFETSSSEHRKWRLATFPEGLSDYDAFRAALTIAKWKQA